MTKVVYQTMINGMEMNRGSMSWSLKVRQMENELKESRKRSHVYNSCVGGFAEPKHVWAGAGPAPGWSGPPPAYSEAVPGAGGGHGGARGASRHLRGPASADNVSSVRQPGQVNPSTYNIKCIYHKKIS